MTDPIGTAQELIEQVAQVIQREAIDRGADSPVDYGDAEQLARAVVDALQSRIAEVGRLEAALGNTLDLIDELYRRHGVELEPDEVAVAQNARAALSLQRRV